MNTYRVTYEMIYPDCPENTNDAYVLSDSFQGAIDIVEKRKKEEFERAEITKVEKIDVEIFV